MALSNAEKQAAWRQRRQQTIEGLTARIAELEQKREPALLPNLGPELPLTADEVEYLRPLLKAYRAKTIRAETARIEREKSIRNAREKYPELDREIKEMERVEIRQIEAGSYYTVTIDHQSRRYEVVSFTVVIDGKGRRVARVAGNAAIVVKLFRRPASKSGWSARIGYGETAPVYREREDAEREAYTANSQAEAVRDAMHRAFGGTVRPYKDMPDAELRKLRSQHHPDKGNADADPAIYQAAIEELDRRRKSV